MSNFSSRQDVTDALSFAISHNSANTIDLFNALKAVHEGARSNNIPIIYPDNVAGNTDKKICLTLYSQSFTHIPIMSSSQVDFNGWTIEITVSSNWEGCGTPFLFLLGLKDESAPLSGIRKTAIDTGNFTDVSALNTGMKLVFIKDETPWTFRNEIENTYWPNGIFAVPWADWNEETPKIRTDILLVKDGVAVNRPIAPYDTMQSNPVVTYVDAHENQAYFKNITFIRTPGCCKVINLAYMARMNNVFVEKINVTTPVLPTLTNDQCLTFLKITNLTIKDVVINNTYSTATYHGYGLLLTCIWNLTLDNVQSTNPQWGVLGCNDLNYVRLESCDLNRFDIHCYGRDVTCVDCNFRNENSFPQPLPEVTQSPPTNHTYNRLSSFYGKLNYIRCTFDGFYPLLTDYTYNVHSGFDIYIENCSIKIYFTANAFLFRMGFWATPLNHRPEHVKRGWPNVFINGLNIMVRDGIDTVHMFFLIDRDNIGVTHPEAAIKEPIYHTSYLHVKNLSLQNMSGEEISGVSLVETNKSYTEVDYAQRVFRFVQGAEYEYTGSGEPRLELTNADFS